MENSLREISGKPTLILRKGKRMTTCCRESILYRGVFALLLTRSLTYSNSVFQLPLPFLHAILIIPKAIDIQPVLLSKRLETQQ